MKFGLCTCLGLHSLLFKIWLDWTYLRKGTLLYDSPENQAKDGGSSVKGSFTWRYDGERLRQSVRQSGLERGLVSHQGGLCLYAARLHPAQQ